MVEMAPKEIVDLVIALTERVLIIQFSIKSVTFLAGLTVLIVLPVCSPDRIVNIDIFTVFRNMYSALLANFKYRLSS